MVIKNLTKYINKIQESLIKRNIENFIKDKDFPNQVLLSSLLDNLI